MKTLSLVPFLLFGLNAYAESFCELSATLKDAQVARELTARATNRFGLELYNKWKGKSDNLFLSPPSISTAFGMTYVGAMEKTASEMRDVFHFAEDAKVFDDGFLSFLSMLVCKSEYRPIELTIANALWKQKGATFLPDYQTRVKRAFDGMFEEVDFKKPAVAAKRINEWTEKQTHGKIRDLVSEKSLSSESRLVLTNAVYFKAAWEHEFRKSETKPGDFYVSRTKTKQVPMMHMKSGSYTSAIYEESTFQLLTFAFKSKQQELVVLLPKAKDGLAKIEAELSEDKLESYLQKARSATVNLTLPKFKLSESYSLADALKAMGMPSAFKRLVANFNGIDGGKDKLFVSEAIHKTFLDLNEEGAEAAAATAVMMAAGAGPPKETPPVEFKADHPFFFGIYDRSLKTFLFLGRLSNPK